MIARSDFLSPIQPAGLAHFSRPRSGTLRVVTVCPPGGADYDRVRQPSTSTAWPLSARVLVGTRIICRKAVRSTKPHASIATGFRELGWLDRAKAIHLLRSRQVSAPVSGLLLGRRNLRLWPTTASEPPASAIGLPRTTAASLKRCGQGSGPVESTALHLCTYDRSPLWSSGIESVFVCQSLA